MELLKRLQLRLSYEMVEVIVLNEATVVKTTEEAASVASNVATAMVGLPG